MKVPVVFFAACLCHPFVFAGGASDSTPEDVLAGLEKRIDNIFRAESGKPLKRAEKQPPLGPGRGNYVRAYSWTLLAFATRCFYLGEQLPEANAALVENAQHYLDNLKDVNDRDSFHWHASSVLRLIELYGRKGSRDPGRMTPATERKVLEPIWQYARTFSNLKHADIENSRTWHIWQSENHHSMIFTLCWHFAKLAMADPEYRDRKYSDGSTAAAHYRAWNLYFRAYARERARKGVCIEMMNSGYNSTWIKGFYNFYDFGDPATRRAAGRLLDLYFAYWAQEQIDGVSGGGQSRIYFKTAFGTTDGGGTMRLAWTYFGLGERPRLNGHDVDALLSDYRPPAVVADIALDVRGRGTYEVRQRAMGLGLAARVSSQAIGDTPYVMRTDFGGILRYTMCDPAFIMGTPMVEARPLKDWAAISSQNRWQGVIFNGHHRTRIVPIIRAKDNRVVLNGFWSVQSKGSLITQKLPDNRGGAEMIIWLSKVGLGNPVEDAGIVFVEAPEAFAAIRVVEGGYQWARTLADKQMSKDLLTQSGHVMVLKNDDDLVILEVQAKGPENNFELFKRVIITRPLKITSSTLSYTTLYGDELGFDRSRKTPPTINGKPVHYAPKRVFDSPFVKSDWNSGVVTIRKGTRQKILDFNQED